MCIYYFTLQHSELVIVWLTLLRAEYFGRIAPWLGREPSTQFFFSRRQNCGSRRSGTWGKASLPLGANLPRWLWWGLWRVRAKRANGSSPPTARTWRRLSSGAVLQYPSDFLLVHIYQKLGFFYCKRTKRYLWSLFQRLKFWGTISLAFRW